MTRSNPRGEDEIIADILQKLSEKNHNKTQIMYLTDLNSKMISQYMPLLLENKLIESNGKRYGGIYSITEKGEKYLELSKKIKILLEGSS